MSITKILLIVLLMLSSGLVAHIIGNLRNKEYPYQLTIKKGHDLMGVVVSIVMTAIVLYFILDGV